MAVELTTSLARADAGAVPGRVGVRRARRRPGLLRGRTAQASRRSCCCRPGRSSTRGSGRRRSPSSRASTACVTFDGRGNGRSDRPTASEAYDEREFALDALAVLDATGTARAVIVGYSLGAPRGLILATEQPERVAGAVFIGPAYAGGGEPLPERVMPWEDELDTDEGWAKYNRHYWLRDYRGFLDFFFGRLFREAHSTKQIEDCVGWGLETTAETLIAAQYGAKPGPEEAQELARRVQLPGARGPRRRRRNRVAHQRARARRAHGRRARPARGRRARAART